jgi:putative hemolysin
MSNSSQQENQATEGKPNFVVVLADVIKQSRDLLGQPPLDESRLFGQARTWMKFCFRIPADRLMDCYLRWADSGPRQALRHIDLIEAWRLIKDEERLNDPNRNKPVIIEGQVTYKCRYCFDTGYQIVFEKGARGCVCEACPLPQRSQSPLCEPEWEFVRNRGHWRRAKMEAA